MDKLTEIRLGKGGVVLPQGIPAGVDVDKYMTARNQKAVMKARVTDDGSVLVNCPYCALYYRKANPVDVTRFVEQDGKKEVKTECSKGHTLRFRSVDNWRDERQQLGLQKRA